MYIASYGSFDCASFIRGRKPHGYSAPREEVEACISRVSSKDDQLSCLFWFMRCMCCDYGRCTDHQKSKGMGKGKCSSAGAGLGSVSGAVSQTTSSVMDYISQYWYIFLGLGGVIYLIARK